MRIPTLRIAFSVLIASSFAAELLRAAEPDAERLVEELKSDDFDLRRNAATQLEALGEKARAALQKAVESDQPEVRATAAGLLKKLQTSSLIVMAYDRDGKPLGGVDADVKLYARQRAFANEWTEPRNENVQTQPNGRVEIGNLSPGLLNIQFEWKKMSVARDSTAWWNLDLQRGPNPVVMTLARGAEVSFLIKNEKGEPLKDATVTLYANRALEGDLLEFQLSLIEQWDRSGLTATADKDGVAKFESINEGSFQAIVRADGHLPALGPVITSRSGQVLSIPEMKLSPKTAGKLQMVLSRHADNAKEAKDPKEKAKQAEADAAKVMEVAKAMEAAKAGDAAKLAEAAKAAAEDAKKKAAAAAKADEAKDPNAKDPNVKEAPKEVAGGKEKPAEVADANLVKKQRVYYELEYVFEGPGAEELQKKQRQLRQALNMYRQAESPETDEQGKITIEDLKPGRYRLTVGSGTDTPWRVDELVVKAGETTDLGVLKNADGGTVKGKLLDTEGKGLQYMNVTAMPETDEDEENPFRQNFSSRQLYGSRNVQTQKDGTYEFKNLLPGRYVLTTYTRKAQPVRIEGIVIEAGKIVEAPEARIPTEGGGKSFVVKGVVKQPDGKPAANANINLHSATFGRWTRNTDDKGQFDFNFSPEQGWTPTAVSAKAANCKAVRVDLTGPGVNFENVVIQLEKQEYGTLKVRVTDEKGKALEGAVIRPRQNRTRYNAFNQVIDRRATTNRSGEARISGLAAGQRVFTVELDGYYAPDALNVMVLPDGEAEASIQMKRGMVLRGRVEIPDGMQASAIAAVLGGPSTQTSPLDAEGRFEFDGLAPGEYSIGALGPALTVLERQKLTLKAGDVPPDVLVKVARPGGAAFAMPQNYAYGNVTLVRREKEKDGAAGQTQSFVTGGVDRDGRVEAWGAAPGQYEVLVHPSAPMSVLAPYRQNLARQVREARASIFAGSVAVLPLKAFDELRTAEAVKLDVPDSSASVKGSIAIVPPLKNAQQSTGNLTVRLVNEQAQATASFNFPNELSQNNQQRAPLIFGESKKTKPATTTQPGTFKFTGLPPGEYKLFVEIVPYRYSQTGVAAEPKEKKTPVPLQIVTVKAGEALELGAIEFKPTQDVMEASRQVEDMNFDMEPEDQVPVFQP